YNYQGELDTPDELPYPAVVDDAYLINGDLWVGVDDGGDDGPGWDNLGPAPTTAVLSLINDEATPDPTHYYGTDAAGNKGWHPVSDAVEAAAGELTKAVGGDGVTTFGLPDVTPTPGGTLQRYGFDAKGRRSEEEAADTDDLAEGSANLYFTNDRADARITAQKGQPNGLATLDADAKLEANQLPALAITDTFVVNTEAAMLALDAQQGDVAVRTDEQKSYILTADPASTLGNWQELLTPTGTGGTVTSVALSVPTGLTVSGSPITSSGTITVNYDTGYQGYTSAEASKLAGIEARMPAGSGELATAAAVSSLSSTVSTQGGQISALASDLSSVSVDLGNTQASVTQLMEVSASDSNSLVILDPGFELNNGWTLPAEVNYSTASPQSGGWCLRFNNTTASRYVRNRAITPVQPGKRIRFRFWTRATGVLDTYTARFGATFYDASGTQLGGTANNHLWSFVVSTSHGHTLREVEWTVPNDVFGIRVYCALTGGTNPGGTGDRNFYFDNISAQVVDENLADSGWTSISVGSGWSATNLAHRRFGTRVKLRGSIWNTSGTQPPGTVVLTLPAGYRPSTLTMFLVPVLVSGAGDYRRVAVGDNGDIVLPDGLPGGATFWFDGIDFYTD